MRPAARGGAVTACHAPAATPPAGWRVTMSHPSRSGCQAQGSHLGRLIRRRAEGKGSWRERLSPTSVGRHFHSQPSELDRLCDRFIAY